MFKFEDVSVSFAGQRLFANVTFTLQKGEKCGLVGRNGAGKSTLFRLIEKELEPDMGAITFPKNYRIGYLRQEIRFTAESVIDEAAKSLQIKEERYKAEKILFGLGFSEEDMTKSPNAFSGGFHLRLHLAKVLIEEPDCLLLDEPTNYLDILSMRWLTHFLMKWPGEFILISHDREFMDKITTHTMGIHRERVKKIKGTSIDFFQKILLEEEVYENRRIKVEKKRTQVAQFALRFGAKATKAKQTQSKIKLLAREPILEKLNALISLQFSFHEASFPGKKMLEARNLQFSFSETPLIHDLTFEILKGEKIAIIGKNGYGKSTLLRLLAADLLPQKGRVRPSEHTQIGYFGQTHIEKLNPHYSIIEEISAANSLLNDREVKNIAGGMLFSGALFDKKISVLSGGEKSRVLLGQIIAKPCNLLLLDEPTHHLDIESIEALIDALENFTGSLVIVTHSELILKRLDLTKLIVCHEAKQTIFLGGYEEFLEKMGWEEETKKLPIKKNQKDLRKQHADWIAARASALRPLSKQIADYESKLQTLEHEQKKHQSSLELGQFSPELLRNMGKVKKEVEEIESKLYELYELFEKRKKEFE